ncbi:MAG: DUF962 domain-containing protein [Betaproteobacteria bacterium]|nr:DUF962 domain-containing protein [Betaproteobacteria bacterium]
MRTVRDWLDEYSTSHVNRVNQKYHFVCIPLIAFSIVCALKAAPLGNAWLNPATVVMAAALAYYLWLSWRLALGVLLAFAGFYAGALGVESAAGDRLIWAALGIFVVGWVGQFIGHAIEGTRPSFFKDLQFLLIGPLWELAHLYRSLGLSVDGAGAARHDINHA